MKNLLLKKPNFILYDGFEPSGRMHIAQGVFKAMNVNKATKAGGTFIFWVADWFALMNDKMGGDLEKIKTVGKYLIEVWKAVGMDMERVKFLWSSEEITHHADQYWTQALDIARRFTLARVTKCCQIMGRLENNLTAAQILYPIMQCTDIFFLKADICQLGVDQRKVNMLARDYCDAAGLKLKPIILSHHMLYGLKKGQQKMSKSDPFSAIFMEDTDEEICKKLGQAYCPIVPEEIESLPNEESMRLEEDPLMNPCLDYVRYIVFSSPGAKMEISGKTYSSFEQVKEDLLAEVISEKELKGSLIEAISSLIRPVREHFERDPQAKELLSKILSYKKEAVATETRFRHLAVNKTKAPWVVFAPVATEALDLDALLALVQQLAVPPKGAEIILWLPDWTSFTKNALGGDKKAIAAAYALLIAALRAAAPDRMQAVSVTYQSEAILSNPSDYWISVINVGRKFNLGRVLAVDEDGQVAGVLGALMHVGDVLATGAAHVVCAPAERKAHELAVEYYAVHPVPAPDRPDGLPVPQLHEVPPASFHLRAPGVVFDPDSVLLPALDATADVSRKLKKAFCEPGNVAHNPPLEIAKALVGFGGELVVRRKAENGGDRAYVRMEELWREFEGGELHPGDLKPAVSKLVEEFFGRIREGQKATEVKNALTTIKNYIKKAASKKK
uniref:tyrosine--tRNA ligase n=1 Tax=Arcella intermedia TaxID=1963864 RepID=A0A6B2KYW3_9EUKA